MYADDRRMPCRTARYHLPALRLTALFAGMALLFSSTSSLAATTGTDTGQASPDANSQAKPKTLKAVTVTGSLIRRVDVETSNPVVTIDSNAIKASGKETLGDLVQQLPSIAGNATNPGIDNGGGTGASTVSLRGLGDNRTLVLVNGRRLAYEDVNSIPASMVERIEVLSDGASSVYGSDAIGGVVNFILKDKYQGVQISSDYGISSHGDGQRRNFSVLAGLAAPRYNLVVGASHQTINAISASARAYSRYALALNNGQVVRVGSSATPGGLIENAAGDYVTLNPGVTGNTTLADYHDYSSTADSYNYQPYNLIQTPQDRTNLSLIGDYKITPNVDAYVNLFYTRTSSASVIAPVPIFANADDFFISKDSYYNPFGVNFGTNRATGESYNDFNTRLTSLGNRNFATQTYDLQFTPGLRGYFGDSSWQWNADFNYGRVRQKTENEGFINYAGLEEALGPSFLDSSTGVVTCGTAAAPISNCTPINIFNINDPSTVAALKKLIVNPVTYYHYTMKQYELGANGELFDLPAGAVNLAVGASYRTESQSDGTDTPLATAIASGDYAGLCGVIEDCGSVLSGRYSVKEVYAETLVPILADKPFFYSLNLDLGSRYSRYSTSAGSSTNSKVALEWRPIRDLLLRGTVSQVFRAPNIGELYSGVSGGAYTATDICNGYTGGHPQACANVPTDGSFEQNNAQLGVKGSGSVAAGYDLKPEYGKSFDLGLVYAPHWVHGLSFSADVWRINLNDTIVDGLDPTTIQNECYYSDKLCELIHRSGNGQISYISLPTVNLGKTWAKGIDSSIVYAMDTDYGKFTAQLNATYMARYDVDTAPGDADVPVTHCAGSYCPVYGEFPRWRGLVSLSWDKGPWNVNWTSRYIGRTRVGDSDLSQNYSADESLPGVERKIGAYVYNNLSASYDFSKLHTRVSLGVDNIANKEPPMFYQWGSNSNTDAYTYDQIGRYYWARATVTF